MKRVIDGVEYEAIKNNHGTCEGCVGYYSSTSYLCNILQKDCRYKIWKISEEKVENTEQSSEISSNNKPYNVHKHAEAMKLYAEDAATTDKPWKLWEVSYKEGANWYPLSKYQNWNSKYNYRRKAVKLKPKPKTININGYEVPEPLQNAPEGGTMYWYPNTSDTHVSCSYYYSHYQYHVDRLVNGLVHLTQESAQKHLEALLSFTRKGK